jgi:predicted site-specific integrase-resolvase
MNRRPLATPKQLSEYLAVPETTLRQWRYLGTGPKYTKAGQLVRYNWADVEAWLAESRKTA